MTPQLLTVEQYERHRHYKALQDEAEAVVNFIWKLKQPTWTSYTLEERSAIDYALDMAESRAYFYSKKARNVLKHTNIQKHNSAESAL